MMDTPVRRVVVIRPHICGAEAGKEEADCVDVVTRDMG